MLDIFNHVKNVLMGMYNKKITKFAWEIVNDDSYQIQLVYAMEVIFQYSLILLKVN